MNNISKNTLISIIVLNYNGLEFLDKCISSIFRQKYSNIEVILVDNASTDNSVNFVMNKFPQVKIIKNNTGLGFGGGNLVGAKAAKGKKILLVSNDTWMDPNLVMNLNKYFNSHTFNVIAPYQSDYDGNKIPPNTSLIDPLGHHMYQPNTDTLPFYLTGVCLFCEKNFYLRTRGMDPKFFLYIEDVDWFWRLLLFGYTFNYVPNVYICHKGGGSSGGHDTKNLKPDIFRYRNRNTIFMLLKNYSVMNLLMVIPLYVIINIAEIVFFLISMKTDIVRSYITSWLEVISGFEEIMKERRWIQKNRVISDSLVVRRMYKGSAKLAHLWQFYGK